MKLQHFIILLLISSQSYAYDCQNKGDNETEKLKPLVEIVKPSLTANKELNEVELGLNKIRKDLNMLDKKLDLYKTMDREIILNSNLIKNARKDLNAIEKSFSAIEKKSKTKK